MNTQKPKEIYTRNLNFGKGTTGPYEVYLNGEGFHAVEAYVDMGCSPTGCSKTVAFHAPEEARTRRMISLGLQLDLPPGTYPIDGKDVAFGGYVFSRRGSSGWFVTVYNSSEGFIQLNAYDEETLHMHGSFEFVVMVEGQRQTVSGKFNIKAVPIARRKFPWLPKWLINRN